MHNASQCHVSRQRIETYTREYLCHRPSARPPKLSERKTTLGNNVKNYTAFYARDERSFGFNCVIPKTDSSTNVHIYPMAGRHGTLVGNAADNGSMGPKVYYEPGEIVRHYAETCLTNWVVSLDKNSD